MTVSFEDRAYTSGCMIDSTVSVGFRTASARRGERAELCAMRCRPTFAAVSQDEVDTGTELTLGLAQHLDQRDP